MKKLTVLFAGMLSMLSYTNLIAGDPTNPSNNLSTVITGLSPAPPLCTPKNWTTCGNVIGSSDFLGDIGTSTYPLQIGTRNAVSPQPILFFTQNIQRMVILPTGDIQLNNFGTPYTSISGLVSYDANNGGLLQALQYTGSNTDVLNGQGNFVSLASLNAIVGPWVSVPSGIAYNSTPGNVAIGALIPQAKFYVRGSDATGVISQFDNGGGTASSNNLMFLASGLSASSNYNHIAQVGDNGIFWSDGGARATFNTSSGFVIAPHKDALSGIRIDASGNVGVGVSNPSAKLDVRNNGPTEIHAYATSSDISRIWTINNLFAYGLGTDANGYGGIYANYNSPLEIMTFTKTGNIGIGTATPATKLEVNGDVTIDNDPSLFWTSASWRTSLNIPLGSVIINENVGPSHLYMGYGVTDDGSYAGWYWANSLQAPVAYPNNNATPNYIMSLLYNDLDLNAGPTLNVNGLVRAHEVRVCLSGCDFVFEDGYKLMDLKELDTYIQQNHHLPGIAPAKEMETADGVALGKMNSNLLQKVEELTLYTIKLQKQVDGMQQLKDEVAELKAEISQMKQAAK